VLFLVTVEPRFDVLVLVIGSRLEGRFKVLTAVSTKMTVFWVVAPCNTV
jgi:hypothetical protein